MIPKRLQHHGHRSLGWVRQLWGRLTGNPRLAEAGRRQRLAAAIGLRLGAVMDEADRLLARCERQTSKRSRLQPMARVRLRLASRAARSNAIASGSGWSGRGVVLPFNRQSKETP